MQGYTITLKVNDGKTVHSAFVRFPNLMFELRLSPHQDEILAVKIESTPWEQAVDDVRPFIALPDDPELLTRENMLIFSNSLFITQSKRYIQRGIYHVYGYKFRPAWNMPQG